MTDELPPAEPVLSAPVLPEPVPFGPEPLVRKPGRGRWVALGSALVLSAVAVGGGVGYGVLQVTGGSKHRAPVAATPAPSASPKYGAMSDGNHFGSLSDLLQPVPSSMEPGPDDQNYGNDTVLTTEQFHGLFDQQIKSFSAKERKSAEQGFSMMFIRGYALRTYMVYGSTEIEITLRQENQKVALSEAGTLTAVARDTGLFRAGPAVPGFPDAHCYLPPLAVGDKLDVLECDAAVGDIYVRLDADGVAPLDSKSAVDLLAQQLTRLAIPGAQT